MLALIVTFTGIKNLQVFILLLKIRKQRDKDEINEKVCIKDAGMGVSSMAISIFVHILSMN